MSDIKLFRKSFITVLLETNDVML